MPESQPGIPVSPSPAAGVFGTKIPSTVVLGIGVLLFFLPFIDIKCNTLSLQTVSGFELATGFKVKKNDANNSAIDPGVNIKTTRSEKEDPNKFAMIAFILGIISFALSFSKSKFFITTATITSALSAAALIGLYIDIKQDSRINSSNTSAGDASGFEKLGRQLAEGVKISVDFTPWFFVAVIAFLVGAFFCYRRLRFQQ